MVMHDVLATVAALPFAVSFTCASYGFFFYAYSRLSANLFRVFPGIARHL